MRYTIRMKIIINWIISALAIGIAAWLVPGVTVTLTSALIAAVVIGFINSIIRPVLILLTLPVSIVTLGLFTFVINGLLILLAAAIVPGFEVSGILAAIVFGIVLAVVNMVLSPAKASSDDK